MSANPTRYHLSEHPSQRVKRLLEAAAAAPVRAAYIAFEGGTNYHTEVGFDDCEIVSEFESEVKLDSDQAGKTLEKPRITIITEVVGADRLHIPQMLVEFMIAVNARPHGVVYINAYSQLCQVLCDIKENGGLWQKFGLLPRIDNIMVTPIRDGSVISEELRNRLLVVSVVTTCSILGDFIR